ncbi:MAG: FMN-binding negative transcriptional regulator [Trueperaceae bacterium]|nr:MAG: FMN-binding negative transcriptional regulator [Trueperaceae bacterium]
MYIPNLFRETDTDSLVAFMHQHSFATVVSIQDGAPVATHLPLTVHRHTDTITLRGHFAKANPQWRALAESETLAIFTGPHAYISPKHYETRESVPTWNYLAVHAYGQASTVQLDDDAGELTSMLSELIAAHEPSYQHQWDTLPERYRDGMLRGVVGFEMVVTRLEGKAKLSQNKNEREQKSITAALLTSEDPAAKATGEEMRRRREEAQEDT